MALSLGRSQGEGEIHCGRRYADVRACAEGSRGPLGPLRRVSVRFCSDNDRVDVAEKQDCLAHHEVPFKDGTKWAFCLVPECFPGHLRGWGSTTPHWQHQIIPGDLLGWGPTTPKWKQQTFSGHFRGCRSKDAVRGVRVDVQACLPRKQGTAWSARMCFSTSMSLKAFA